MPLKPAATGPGTPPRPGPAPARGSARGGQLGRGSSARRTFSSCDHVRGRLDPVQVELVHALDVLEDRRQLGRHPLELGLGQLEPGQPRDVEDLVAVDHDADCMSPRDRIPPADDRARAERFVVANLRLLAVSFAVVGILFIAVPNGVLDVISRPRRRDRKLHRRPARRSRSSGSRSAFAYMVVITGICAGGLARRRPLPAAAARPRRGQDGLVAGGARLLRLRHDVFAYLLNFIVDGFLVGVALFLWSLAGRIGEPAAPPEGARRGFAPPSCGPCARSPRRWRPASAACPAAVGTRAPRTPPDESTSAQRSSLPGDRARADGPADRAGAAGARVAAVPVAILAARASTRARSCSRSSRTRARRSAAT